jgi:hypothetical protein
MSGAFHHSTIVISAAYPNWYIWSDDGLLADGTGSASVGLKWNRAVTTTSSLVNPITVTSCHVNSNGAERGPDSGSGLHGESDG